MRLVLALCALVAIGCGMEKRQEHKDQPSVQIPLPPPGKITPTPMPTVTATPIPNKPPVPPQLPAPTPTMPPQNGFVSTLQEETWRVQSGKVFFKDQQVYLRGINWFGFEGGNLVVHGLWTGRTVDSFLAQMQELGFNSLRIPMAPEALDAKYTSTNGKGNPYDNLVDLLDLSAKRGFSVLLDLHTCNFRNGLIGSPLGCPNYNAESWYRTLEKMATLSKNYPHVLGIDIFNEPYNLSWKQWRDLSTEAGRRILAVNPNLLIFVEGVANQNTDNGGFNAFWGENLVEAGANPPGIPPSKLVLSPHAYGPSVAWQDYFGAGNFPANMPTIWDRHFGYLIAKGYTIVPTEFGGRYVDKDKQWGDAFVSYLRGKGIAGFYYWCLNPNSGDTGGILNDDWYTVNQDKMTLLRRIF